MPQPWISPASAATSIISGPACSAAKYWTVLGNFVFSLTAEAGYIRSFENGGPGIDPVRLTDRFFLGSPQIRGFDIRGVGPRIQRVRYTYTTDTNNPDGPAQNVALDTDPSEHHRRCDRRPGLLSRPRRARNPAWRQRARTGPQTDASMSTWAPCSASGLQT